MERIIQEHREILKLSEKVRGPKHPTTIDHYLTLAGVYRVCGKPEEELSIRRTWLDMRQEVFGVNPHHLTERQQLAQRFDKSNRRKEGLAEWLKLVEMTAKIPEFSKSLSARYHLSIARDYFKLGNNEDSLKHYDLTLALRPPPREIEDEKTLFIMAEKAGKLGRLGRLEEEVALRQEIVDLRTKIFDEHAEATVTARNSLLAAKKRKARKR